MLKGAAADDLGFTRGADLARWPEAVRRVAARYPEPRAIVPGHGAVDFENLVYQHTLDLLAP